MKFNLMGRSKDEAVTESSQTKTQTQRVQKRHKAGVRQCMVWVWQWLLIGMSAAGLSLGFAFLQAPIALAPATEIEAPGLPDLSELASLAELYQVRDRLLEQVQNAHNPNRSPSAGLMTHQLLLSQAVQTVQIKIHIEETAQAHFEQAMQLAKQAVIKGKGKEQTLASLQQAEALWNDAIAQLQTISDETLIAAQAQQKRQEYGQYRDQIAYKVDVAQSSFLGEIAGNISRPDRVRIAVCQVSTRDCRYWNGDEPPDSAASLIKVPIAIALMDKVTREGIDLDTQITVSRGNYTEDPQGSKIWPGQEHSLRELLFRMIDHSSNIATNQLIDYVGWDYINQVMRDRGYEQTQVHYKLVGEHTYPANAGTAPNRITAAELTHMMVGIYNQEHPGDDVLLDALVRQYDWDFGYKALQRSPGNWAGEKTGQNSRVIGTTVAVNFGGVGGEVYVITLTIDRSANPRLLHQGIRDIVAHIDQQGHL
jgi:beta-lactamase class A